MSDSDPKIKIIPAKVVDPNTEDNTVYVSQTNESTSLKITHYT